MARISENLMAVLRCPVTGSPLVQDGAELFSTVPGPDGAPVRYVIDEGIPVLLVPETATSD